MIKNYVITAWRNIMRHKLFATINIIGLACSMSVGLLIVSLVSDLLSYDNFHKSAYRTYRLVTTRTTQGVEPEDYASSSAKTGKLIRESITGVQEVTIVRNNAGGNVGIGEKIVPIGMLYADNSFFKVFDFELAQGDRAKALAEPYSLVLTEKARKRLFGDEEAIGRSVRLKQADYIVTGILREVPHLTHLRFEGLVSLSTAELEMEQEFNDWTNIYSSYVYLVLDNNTNSEALQLNLDKIASTENILPDNASKFALSLQPLTEIAFGRKVTNQSGPVMPASAIKILIGLGLVVIISSCFNYTSLSIARALKRSREVGLRKISGALRRQARTRTVPYGIDHFIAFGTRYRFFLVSFASSGISFPTHFCRTHCFAKAHKHDDPILRHPWHGRRNCCRYTSCRILFTYQPLQRFKGDITDSKVQEL